MMRRANPRDQPLLECETVHAGGRGADVDLMPSHRFDNHERPQPAHHYGVEKLIWNDDDVKFTVVNGKKSPVYRERPRTGETEILGYIDMRNDGVAWTAGPSIIRAGDATRSVNYPSDAVTAALHDWYARNGSPSGGRVYRSQDQSLAALEIASPDPEPEDVPVDMWGDVDTDWVDYMEIRDAKTVDADTVHQHQASLKDFRNATQADINPDSIEQDDDRLDSLPTFLDDDEFESVSKYAPGTGGPRVCDHCNEPDWHSYPLESGLDALRPGGIEFGDPDHDACHADHIKGCECCGCPRCNGISIEFRVNSQDYRCNGCDLRFSHPVPRQSDGERACLYWQCGECGMATQAAFTGIPEDLLDAAPPHAFDTDDD